MVILGIDPGIADTGFGIITVSGQAYQAQEYGSIKTHPGDSLAQRLADLEKNLTALIKKYSPDTVAIEELFFAKNAKTAITVAHARGVCLMTAHRAGCIVREFKPTEVKQALVGYGRADKNQIQQMVKMLLSLDSIPKPDDAADALAIAITCAQTKHFS